MAKKPINHEVQQQKLSIKNVSSPSCQVEKNQLRLTSLFFPCQRAPLEDRWLGNGGFETDGNGKVRILQRDLPLELACGTVLGLRLLLQCEGETPLASAPVVLMFHGEDQNIDTFCEQDRMAKGGRRVAAPKSRMHENGYGCGYMMIFEDIWSMWYVHISLKHAAQTYWYHNISSSTQTAPLADLGDGWLCCQVRIHPFSRKT